MSANTSTPTRTKPGCVLLSPRATEPKTDFGELSVSVRQMEGHLQNDPDRMVRYLMSAYRELAPRFSGDLDRRDELLARSAALKLVREVARQCRRAG